jgi:hypothetical protein
MTALREYLAEHPAAEQIGVFDARLETLPARFTIGTAASRNAKVSQGKPPSFSLAGVLGSPKAPLVFVSGFVLCAIVAIAANAYTKGSLGTSDLLSALVFVLIGAALVWPSLQTWRRGVLSWTRQVELRQDRVTVDDITETGHDHWEEPLGNFLGVARRHGALVAGGAPAGHAGSASKSITLDIIELRHPDPGKTLLLYSAPRSKTGGMTMGKMFEMARQGKKNEIKAAMNSPENPDLDARLARYQALLQEQGTNA